MEHRQHAGKHLDNISTGLVLASNRLVLGKKIDNSVGLAISTLHHSGDQNKQIMRMLERILAGMMSAQYEESSLASKDQSLVRP